MDAQRFDRLAVALGQVLNRRRLGMVLTTLGVGASLGRAAEAEARKKKKKKKKKGGGGGNQSCTPGQLCGSDAQGNCVCDALATGGPPVCNKAVAVASAGSCAGCPAGTTCVDDVTEFACFQPCGAPACVPACANGKPCNNNNDCQSAFCLAGTCQVCGSELSNCGGDADGQCSCFRPRTGGETVCGKNTASVGPVTDCGMCPAGMICANFPGGIYCTKRCGSA